LAALELPLLLARLTRLASLLTGLRKKLERAGAYT
jgi:hypothetical protein